MAAHGGQVSLYDRAAIIPGRSLTRSKAPDRLIKAWAAGASGAVLWDTEGLEYIDMLCGLGAISLGYQPHRPQCRGVYSLPHVLEVEAAEAVLQHVAPWASSVRFVKTGSEATHAAYRIAKAATGRKRILVMHGAYHGWHEWCSGGAGVELFADDYLMPLNEREIAAVFYEPPRFVDIDADYVRWLRNYCDTTGALLVFDEMIWGGRYALGGCTEYHGVIPDLACYGKAFGNGEAVAFVVGRDALHEHGEIVSGTYSGDTTGLQAVLDTLHTYTTEPVIETLWARGRQLQAGLKDAIPADLGVVEGQPVHQRIRFREATPAPAGAYDYRTEERKVAKRFREGMAERGVLMLPDAINVMYAHTEQQIDTVIAAVRQTVQEMA
jgi:glutamate-1-semialdehyde aminotransferase